MNKFLCLIYFLFSGTLPLAGQAEPGGETKRIAGRAAWFVYTDLPVGIENPVKVLAGREITEVKLEQYMASEPVKIPEDGIIRIVRAVPDPANPEKPKYLVQAEAKIPENVREALIILMPIPKPEGDKVLLAKIQDLAAFKGGDRFFINLSDTDISVQLGDKTTTVPAKQAEIYSSPQLEKSTNIQIIYRFYHSERREWLLLSASTAVLRPTRREISIFNNGTRIGNIKKYKIIFPAQGEKDSGKEQ